MYSPGMPSVTKKMKRTRTGLRAVAVSAAAASLLGALSGCVRLDTIAPSAARAQASATAQARFGTVDCRHANGAKSE